MKAEESIKRRVDSILAEVKARGFDTVVFVNEIVGQSPANFLYVSGLWGYGEEHAALIFGLNGRSTVILPHWRASKMEEKRVYDHVIAIKQEKGQHIKAIREALERFHDAKRVCFDLSTMSAQFAFRLMKVLKVDLNERSDISDHVFKLRTIKDQYEIDEIRKAIKITEEAVLELGRNTRPGLTATELKKKMDASMIEKGAIEFSFESTLSFAAGLPRLPGPIKHGDMLAVDVGCRVPSGYCSDMGRNIPLTPNSEVKDYLNQAASAHKESMRLIRDGVIASEVLEGSNRVNAEHGFDPMVRCGHQIGLECHEYTMPFAPNFGSLEEDKRPLMEGMTVTYEPPHNIAEKGLRTHFEDIILVTKGGPVVLNELPLDFLW